MRKHLHRLHYDSAGNRTAGSDTSGTSGSWAEKTYTLGSGSHTFAWRYAKNGSGYSGEDCGLGPEN